MEKTGTSRERMLAALGGKTPGRPPCCFMIFSALRGECRDHLEFVDRQTAMGLDARVELPELPFRHHAAVTTETSKTNGRDDGMARLHKRYRTPKGDVVTVVRQTGDWPYGDEVPFLNDYLSPRAERFPFADSRDIEKLPFLLGDPTAEDIALFREEAKVLKRAAAERGLAVGAGWHSGAVEKGIDRDGGAMGADALFWLCGGERALLMAMDEPEALRAILGTIASWNLRRMGVYLDEGVDLIVRRAWYEGTEIWSPALYREFLAPVIRREVDAAHQAGAKYVYIMTSGALPLLEEIMALGVDAIMGVDAAMGNWGDFESLKARTRGRICLWGGVNGFLTVERGAKEDVERAVAHAVGTLGRDGGFILSPVDNVTAATPRARENVRAFIEAWRASAGG